MSQDNKDPLVCAKPVVIHAGDPVLRVQREYIGLNITLEQAQKELDQRGEAGEEEEHLSIS